MQSSQNQNVLSVLYVCLNLPLTRAWQFTLKHLVFACLTTFSTLLCPQISLFLAYRPDQQLHNLEEESLFNSPANPTAMTTSKCASHFVVFELILSLIIVCIHVNTRDMHTFNWTRTSIAFP